MEINPEPEPADEPESELDQEEQDAEANEDAAQQQEAAALAQPAQDAIQEWAVDVNDPIEQVAQLPPGGAVNHLEQVPQDAGNQQVQADMAQLRSQVERIQARQDAPDKAKYVMATAGVVTAVYNIIAAYFLIKSNLAGPKAEMAEDVTDAEGASPPVSPQSPQAAQLANAWLNESESAFWQNLAVWVRENSPRSWEEQLMFCQYTEDLALKLQTGVFRWNRSQDKLAEIANLSALLGQDDGLATMYETLPTIEYGGKPLPRAVAANLGAHAIVQWHASQGGQPSDASAQHE